MSHARVDRLRGLGRLWRGLKDESGQAMTEYAATTSILLLVAAGLGTSWPVTRLFFNAFNHYFASIYYVLMRALP